MSEPVQAQPLIAVKDVAASSRWYQTLLGLESAHGGDEYDEVWLRDLDSYVVVIAGQPGDV